MLRKNIENFLYFFKLLRGILNFLLAVAHSDNPVHDAMPEPRAVLQWLVLHTVFRGISCL